jgi:hypothetical protein
VELYPKRLVVAVCENPLVENYIKSVLERFGCQVILCEPRRAIELLNQQQLDLLITNSPTDFLSVAGAAPFLYLSSAPDPALAAQFPKVRVLEKPFRAEDLLRAVKELTGA